MAPESPGAVGARDQLAAASAQLRLAKRNASAQARGAADRHQRALGGAHELHREFDRGAGLSFGQGEPDRASHRSVEQACYDPAVDGPEFVAVLGPGREAQFDRAIVGVEHLDTQ